MKTINRGRKNTARAESKIMPCYIVCVFVCFVLVSNSSFAFQNISIHSHGSENNETNERVIQIKRFTTNTNPILYTQKHSYFNEETKMKREIKTG